MGLLKLQTIELLAIDFRQPSRVPLWDKSACSLMLRFG